jgi:cytochrome bd ubiquinol oxidase subunit II
MLLEFATIKVVWWLLLGALLIGFAIMDGFDLGVGMLLPFVARTDVQRRVVINTVGPVWEGNQVWFILGGGAIFAAWPTLYAASFSGFYLAMLLVLAALILRPVGFKFRSKMPGASWRSTWDWALFIGGFVPSLVFGVAMGNLLRGVPFGFDSEMRATYDFGLFYLLNPFALLCGVLSVVMLATHGARYLVVKTEAPVAQRAALASRFLALAWLAIFAAAGFWLWRSGFGLHITSGALPDGVANPLAKTVVAQPGAWFDNYARWPWLRLLPCGAAAGGVAGTLPVPACGFRHQCHWCCRSHRYHRSKPVSVPAALFIASGQQPDGLGFIEQPSHAFHHAHRHHRVPAHRPCLHKLGVSGHAWPGNRRTHPRKSRFNLLRQPCGISAGFWGWVSRAVSRY